MSYHHPFRWVRVNRKRPCLICQHFEWCEVSEDGQIVHCMRVPSAKPLQTRGGGWWHSLYSDNPPAQKPTVIVKTEEPLQTVVDKAELAIPAIRARAINWLLAQLALSQEHKDYLASEGFSHYETITLGYRTLPADYKIRRNLLAALDREFGREVSRTLGFVYERKVKGGSTSLEFSGVGRGLDALLIPIRDSGGQPVALKARMVQPDSGERSYRLMSAGNTELGAGVGTPIHVAKPPFTVAAWEGRVIVTEGEKKADYIAGQLGVMVLGVQGVNNWRSGKLLPLLKELNVGGVIEAFDADRNDKTKRGYQNIERQARMMCEQLAAAGYKVFTAHWPLSIGKGLDDYLRNQPGVAQWPPLYPFSPLKLADNESNTLDASFRKKYGVSLHRARRIANQFVQLDNDTINLADAMAARVSAEQDLKSLAVARAELATIFNSAFSTHLLSKGKSGRQVLLRVTTGVGKTTAALNQIITHLALGRPGRIAYLTDTKQAYSTLTSPGGVLAEYLKTGKIAIREGRTKAQGLYHCERYEECLVLGANRQIASVEACATCPFGSQANWEKFAENYDLDPAAPRPFKCEREGYLASVKRAKAAQVVIAPKAAILNASDELAEFDFIIIDEDTVSFLLECQMLSKTQLVEWEAGRRKLEIKAKLQEVQTGVLEYQAKQASPTQELEVTFDSLCQNHKPFDKLFGLVKAVLADFEEIGSGRVRLMPLLKDKATQQGEKLIELVNECQTILPSHRFERYQWEKPFKSGGEWVVPLRFAADFIKTLAIELERAEGSDTSLWLEKTGSGAAVVRVYLVRQNLLNILTGKRNSYPNEFGTAPTVFYLDATAGPLFKLALPQVEEINITVRQNIYFIQITNSLYTGRSLAGDGGRGLAKISQAVDALADRFGARQPVIFSRKAFNPDFVSRSKAGWKNKVLSANTSGIRYGHFERHNKGLDDYSNTDLLAIVGFYCQPLDELTAQVEALRGRATGLDDAEAGNLWELVPYSWQDSNGRGLARWCKANPDLDVQAATRHSWEATVTQTLGRGRAALRAKPLVVVLFSAMPVSGLKVDELTDVSDILQEKRISEKQAQVLAAGRDKINSLRHEEALNKIAAAKVKLAEEGYQFVPVTRLASISNISPDSLYILGYVNRWVKIRAEISQELFISLLTKPVILAGESPVTGFKT